ncbi:MAG: hypothetical protein AMXMBFR56_66030 [Polyangiaceae bacterium]
MGEPKPKEEGPRSFATFLVDLDDGLAHSEVTGELNRLVRLLKERAGGGKAKGKLIFELAVEIEKEHVSIGYDIRLKEPQKKRAGDVFFVTKGCNLSRQDERQLDLPAVRVVTTPPTETRDVQEAP